MTRTTRLASVAFLAILAACGGGVVSPPPPPPPPQSGDLTVSYVGSGAAIGAILFSISGGPVTSVSAAGGRPLQVSFAPLTTGTTKVVVAGTLTTGDILTVRIPDITLATSYTVGVEQVADNVTFSLIDTSLHTLTIHR